MTTRHTITIACVAAVLPAFLPLAARAQSLPEAARRCLAEPVGDRAVSLCHDAVRAAPGDVDVRHALAAALAARSDARGAAAEYAAIARLAPQSASAQLDLATSLDRAGQVDEALNAYRRYAELNPSEPRAHELIGWLLLQKGRARDALIEFREAQRLAPDRGTAHHGAAVALIALDRREEALHSLEAATRLAPEDARIWGAAASTAADLGRTGDAVIAWDRAIRADPAYFDTRVRERKRWESIISKTPRRLTGGPTPNAPSTPIERTATPSRRNDPDASGSGFIVTPDGYVLTNRHVVNGCQSVAIRRDSSVAYSARVVAQHPHDDLAVLQADATFDAVAVFRSGASVRPGDNAVAVGFPLAGLLADEPSVTTGSVSALAGLHNDPAILQMSTPVQQGSSGGPLFDGSGNVIGVVVTKLNARIVAEETGDLPQNVNFALKAELARAFLDQLAIRYSTAASVTTLGNADVGDIGRRVTVMVECYR